VASRTQKRNQIVVHGLVLILFFAPCLSALSEPRANGEEPDAKKVKTSGLAWLPVIYYTPETKWALGGGGIYYFRLTEDKAVVRPSNIAFIAVYTQRKQFSFELNPDLYLGNGYHMQWTLQYSDFPDYFYGIGRETSEESKELYTSRFWKLSIEALKQVYRALNAGFIYFFDRTKLTDIDGAPLLAAGDIPGSGGGTASGLGFFLTYDSRDSIFYPTKGSFHQLSATAFGRAVGSDFTFHRFSLDWRKYHPLAKSHTLAIQSRLLFQTGDPPFWRLGLLGGEESMRGYYLGRYRDKNMIVLQAEYRWVPVIWRLGLAAFVGLGDVADKVGNFDLGNLKYSYGLGLRFVFDAKQKLNIRLDFGFGKGASGVYFTAAEAF